MTEISESEGRKMNDEQWLYSSMDEIIDSTEYNEKGRGAYINDKRQISS